MADFSSLKQTIQSYIKQNGNEEITGNILQDVLLAMVSTMGDSAINGLASALQDEITARQNQDGILQGNITAEATAREQTDTTLGDRIDGLQTAINGINTKLAEGYIYAGIATPSTNPGTPSGKVFYIAVQAGTYTNFGGTVVTEGITILKYNGTSWVKEQALFTDGGVFDISAYNNDTYDDLADALSGNNIPLNVRKGGMSVKFVQSSGNKYVQYRLISDSFNTIESNWQKQGAEVVVEQNTREAATPFISSHSYSVGDIMSCNGGNWKCITAHTSGQRFSITEAGKWISYGNKGNTSISIGEENTNIKGQIILLNNIGSSEKVPFNVGDVFYKTEIKALVQATSSETGYIVLPMFEESIYIFDSLQYIWNGEELVRVSENSRFPLYSIVHPQNTSANYTVSLSANKWYRFVFDCENDATFKVFGRNSSSAKLMVSSRGVIFSGPSSSYNTISGGDYIVRFLGSSIDSIRIIGNSLGKVTMTIYDVDGLEDEVADNSLYENAIKVPIQNVFKAIKTDEYESISTELKKNKTYKFNVVAESFRLTASKSNNPVDIYDLDGNKITSNGNDVNELHSGIYYVTPESDIDAFGIGYNTSGEVIIDIYNVDNINSSKDTTFENTFPQILPNYIMPSADDVMVKYINGSYATSQFSSIYDFSDGLGHISHDATMVIVNGYAYVVFTSDVSSGSDSAYSPTAKVRLKKVNLTDTSDSASYDVAKKDETYGSYTQTGGAGQPNMYNVNGILHITYLANVDNEYVMMHTTYDTSNGTFGSYAKATLTDGETNGNFTQNTLDLILGLDSGSAEYGIQMNSSVGNDGNGTYYYGIAYNHKDGYALILSTTDFINFTYVTLMDFGCGCYCEVACWYKNEGTTQSPKHILYAAKRIPSMRSDTGANTSSNNPRIVPVGKYNISTKKWIASVAVKNCGTRPTFFEYNNQVYLITSGPMRKNAQVIEISAARLDNSKIISEMNNDVFNYPSISIYNSTIYIVGTENSAAHIPLYILELAHYSGNEITQKLLGLMES